MKLRELEKDLETAYELLVESTDEDGEVNPEAVALFREYKAPFDKKVNAYVEIIKRIEAEIDFKKAEETRIKKNRQSLEKGLQWLKSNLVESLQALDYKKIKTDLYNCSVCSTPSVNVLNIDEIPGEFKTVEMNVKIDKTKLKQAIKDGQEIPGAELVDSSYLRIS